MLALPGLSLWANNAARGGTPAPAPTGPDIAALAAMFTVDVSGASATQGGGIWVAHDAAKLFQNSDGTGAVVADGDAVGYMQDQSGRGNHVIQATSGKRPLYKAGTNPWVEFDGSDDALRTGSSIVLSKPWTRISVIRQLTWTSDHAIFGAFQSASNSYLLQNGSEGGLALFDGAYGANNTGATIGGDFAVIEVHNGASSSLQVNSGTPTTGNPGSNGTTGMTIGHDSVTAGMFGNFRLYGVMLIGRALTTAETNTARTELAKLAGLTL